ncbi:uncharacterized protein LOC135835738 [Planococcus citri]|uniref:uncharacterized protein LOC135835738 n=1 Tax=Planococcus citri TaxID=170843 RepID=UPI0031F9B0BB
MNSINEVLNELKDDIVTKPEAFHPPKPQQVVQNEKIENKAYLQQKEYFLEITKDKLLATLSSQDHHPFSWNNFPLKELDSTVDIAISFQRNSHAVSNLCYGLLGGISLMQLVLTYTLVKGSKNELMSFIELYSKFGHVPSASFSILTTICLVFAFDKIDLITVKQLILQEQRKFYSNWILVFLYSVTFILSVLCFKFDEIIATFPEGTETLTTSQDLWMWRTLNLWRCIFGIIGWFFVCITRPHDLLEHRLCALKKSTTENQNTVN